MKKRGLLFKVRSLLKRAFRMPSTPLDSPLPEVAPALNLLVEAVGDVKLKRSSWQDYHPTTFGAVLQRGDLLWPAKGAQVVVLCNPSKSWYVPAGEPSGLQCPPPKEPLLKRGSSLIGHTRAASDPFIPVIITPRMTRLLTRKPRLRWQEVLGASRYTVRIEGVNWEAETSATELVYPGSPPLEPSKLYLLTVKADNGRLSTEEEPTRLGFVLLSEAEAKSVQTNQAKLDALDLSDEAKGLALAHLYATHDLRAEAIDQLSLFAKAGSQTPAIYRLLASLLMQIGLPLLAEKHYMQAISLTEGSHDLEGRAAAQAGLGEVYVTLNNQDEAMRWLSQAKAGYKTLGDTKGLSEVDEQLRRFKKE